NSHAWPMMIGPDPMISTLLMSVLLGIVCFLLLPFVLSVSPVSFSEKKMTEQQTLFRQMKIHIVLNFVSPRL
ncbi:MAG: hypothetical protein IKI15_11150, partial [Lachnospiraceae bacterium]|nr:hypothetical protein [Lachnospiraceae bacterium]